MPLTMTYNFDPERWYEIEYKALESRLNLGEISNASFQKALEDLYDRYEKMVERLDGTYKVS